MYGPIRNSLTETLQGIRSAGLYKSERRIGSSQQALIGVEQGPVLNFCANNYLGLANHPQVLAAAHEALDRWGYGMASVRFICGTQSIHQELEARLSAFLGTEDTILYNSCFDANGGLFDTLLDEHRPAAAPFLGPRTRPRYGRCRSAGPPSGRTASRRSWLRQSRD